MKRLGIKFLVLDVLKPHQPPLAEFAEYIGELKPITKVDVGLEEIDERTESLKVTVEGNSIDFDELKEHIARIGAVVHSVDKVVVAE